MIDTSDLEQERQRWSAYYERRDKAADNHAVVTYILKEEYGWHIMQNDPGYIAVGTGQKDYYEFALFSDAFRFVMKQIKGE